MPTFSAPGRANRRFSPRNLPYTFLFLAIALGFISLCLVAGWLSMPKESDLKSFTGSVQRAPSWVHTKGGPMIRIRVEMDDGLHNLFEEDLSHSREIMKLKPGDHVTARAQSLLGEYHIWELKRDGVTIESYQDTYLYESREHERGVTSALWFGLASSILLTVALALRMYFGAWRASTAPVPAGAVGFSHYRPLSSADYPRTYYTSPGREAVALLGGCAAIGFGFIRLLYATAASQDRDVSSLVPGLFIIAGIIAILRDLRYRVVLSADCIEVRNLASTRVLRRDEILGRRLVQTRGGQILRLMPQGGQRPLGVLLVVNTDSAFWEWMDPIPDLNAQGAL